MTTRMPMRRYIGDGVYVGHDGYQIILETSDGISVTNRIGLEDSTLEGLGRYREYALDFYRTGQHRAGPGCEGCGQDITDHEAPLPGTLRGEVYQVRKDDVQHEVRLCQDCARKASQEFLDGLIARRPAPQG